MFLTDRQISDALRVGAVVLKKRDDNHAYVGMVPPAHIDLMTSKLIQPSSIDLTIGRVYVPPTEPANRVATASVEFETGHQLEPGETAVVETKEHLTLSKGIGAFGFPPAGVSKNSILMTNPGHVDPGFAGHLSFTLINMGRKPFPLRQGDRIASLLIFQLSEDVMFGYSERNAPQKARWAKLLDQLSPDFGAFQTRMAAAAKSAVNEKVVSFEKEVANAKSIFSRAQLLVPLTTALVIGLISYITTTAGFVKSVELETLRSKLTSVEAQLGANDIKAQLSEIERKLQQLEEKSVFRPR